MVRLALITGAPVRRAAWRSRWDDVSETELTFLETKNGRVAADPRLPGHRGRARRSARRRARRGVFTNARTHEAYTVNGVAHIFRRALERAGIATGDVSLHTLRHTALSRMIATGIDDFTVMAISGHRSTRMLERYTHPTTARKLEALDTFPIVGWAESGQKPENDGRRKSWWTARGSNSRPPHCERGALPTELAAHCFCASRTSHTSRGAHPITVALGTCRGNRGLHAAASSLNSRARA